MEIAVAGTGYVGLVTAVCMAEKGDSIICVDTNEEKINMLKKGIVPIYEHRLKDLMVKNKERLAYTTDYVSAYRDMEVIFIAVGTPENDDGSANINFVCDVAKQIATVIQKDCIVVIKSTVPIGTCDIVEELINKNLKNNVTVHVVSNPEFLAQGTAISDTLNASRIVIGVESEIAEKVMRNVYKNFETPILVMNRRSAELVKYASNSFLALKISYINEIANLCEIVGADIQNVSKGMGYDERIGNKFLNSGIGYGGSCFPKDTKALHWLANMNNYEMKTIKAAIEVNEKQKIKLIEQAKKYYDSFKGVRVAVLGLTFKPDTDDIREAPSLANIPVLLKEGAIINAWDPVGIPNFRAIYPENITYCKSIEETITNTDICFIFTEWDEIKQFEFKKFGELMKHAIVLDGRNCFEYKSSKDIEYYTIGR